MPPRRRKPSALPSEESGEFNDKLEGSSYDVGDVWTITRGAELYQPVKYHSYTVGPFTATVTLREGEAGKEAYERVSNLLDAIFSREYARKTAEYIDRAKKAQTTARTEGLREARG